jgi:hypothetical protein
VQALTVGTPHTLVACKGLFAYKGPNIELLFLKSIKRGKRRKKKRGKEKKYEKWCSSTVFITPK